MMVERIRWQKIDDDRLRALPEAGLVRVVVRKKPIAFVRINGVLRAMIDICPH